MKIDSSFLELLYEHGQTAVAIYIGDHRRCEYVKNEKCPDEHLFRFTT